MQRGTRHSPPGFFRHRRWTSSPAPAWARLPIPAKTNAISGFGCNRPRVRNGTNSPNLCAENTRPKSLLLRSESGRAELATEQQKSQQQAATIQTAVSVGASILGAFLGRKALSAATMGRAATAARQASRTYKESQDVSQAKENVGSLVQQLADLQKQFEDEVASLQQKVDPLTEQLDHRTVRPKKQISACKWLVWVGAFNKHDITRRTDKFRVVSRRFRAKA